VYAVYNNMASMPSKGSVYNTIFFYSLVWIFLFSLHPPFFTTPYFVPPPLSLHYRQVYYSVLSREVMLMGRDIEMEAETELSRDRVLSVGVVLKNK